MSRNVGTNAAWLYTWVTSREGRVSRNAYFSAGQAGDTGVTSREGRVSRNTGL